MGDKVKSNIVYDTIIIGAGPSGGQAALYLARAGKSVLVFHEPSIGALCNSKLIENFYGVGQIEGVKLYNNGVRDIQKLGVNVIKSIVTHIEYDYDNMHYMVSDNKSKYRAKTIILAMGKEIKTNTTYKMLAKEKVSYCATCDGFFYRNKEIALIGNSEFTLSEYNHLLNVTSHIEVLTNSDNVNENLKDIVKIETSQILSVANTNDERVKVTFKNKKCKVYDGVFIAEGHFSTSAIARTLGVYVENGFIVVNEKMSTNVLGVFACGDIIGGIFQIAKAVSDGMQTGISVIEYLNNLKTKK